MVDTLLGFAAGLIVGGLTALMVISIVTMGASKRR